METPPVAGCVHTNNKQSTKYLDILQRALYNLGLTDIPIVNVNTNCSTGSTALYQARMLVQSGAYQCALALGFERMNSGSLGMSFSDRRSPAEPFGVLTKETEQSMNTGENHGPGAPRMLANAAQEYFDKYGANIGHLAMIGVFIK